MKIFKYILFLLFICVQQSAFACWDDEEDELFEYAIDEDDDSSDDEYWEDEWWWDDEYDDNFMDEESGTDWWEDEDYDEDSDDWWLFDEWPYDDTLDDTDDVEYEDWNDDDEYPNLLDEIFVYPDYDDDFIGAYDFAYEFHARDSYDDDEDSYWDDYDNNSDDDKETKNNPDEEKSDSTEYHKFGDKDKLVDYKFPKTWAKQETKMGCVPRILGIAAAITLNRKDEKIDMMFSDDYKMKTGRDPLSDGVSPDDIGKFIESEFDSYQVDTKEEIKKAIDNNNCVLGTIENSVGYHEVLIIGYKEDDDDKDEGSKTDSSNDDDKKDKEEGEFIYVDPGTGDYENGDYEDFHFKKYAVKSIK